ncbi:hypothetical protein TNCV_428421 [Trichonephila clavipes]|nr:hypothetical protein TNCV_428421 [Trichonephila clavipes]
MMIWEAIGYTFRSSLVRIDCTSNSVCYISCVLRSLALPFICSLRNPTFQQNNARPHITDIVLTLIDTQMLGCCPGLHWPMVVVCLARHHTPVTMVDKQWHRVEAAYVSVHD